MRPTGGGRIGALAALALAAMVQVWIVSAGRWTNWPQYTRDYSYLADAFLHGRTSLPVTPSAEMLAAADPYNPEISGRYGLHDAVMFQGKYYLYWGPVPALLAAGASLLAGIEHPDFGDQYLVWIFMFLTVALAAVLVWRISAKLFGGVGKGPAVAAMISLGLGTPGLYLLSRAAIYEAAIAAGQCFMLAGFWSAWEAMQRGPGRRKFLLFLTGLFWALSFGSRLSLAPAVFVVAAMVAWRHRKLSDIAVLFSPMLGGAAVLLWYNFVRFHSFTEFGLRYQLVASNLYDLRNAGVFSARYVPHNAACYLLAGPYHLPWFPYVIAYGHRSVLGQVFSLPDGVEPLVGLVWSQPLLALGLAALVRRDESRWLSRSLLLGGLLGIAAALPAAIYTMRYLMDAVPCLTILAFIGYAGILQDRSRRGIQTGVCAILAAQSVLAILLSINGPLSHFPTFNRPLYNAMQSFFGS
jgi:hypothetical protein